MFANGMALMGVYYLWALAIIAVGLLALVSLIFSLVRRTRKRTRKLATLSIVFSLVPFIVPLLHVETLSRYAHGEFAIFAGATVLPLGMSLVAAYCSGRDTPREPMP